MKATLTALCGCTREMQIPYPPSREIVLPLRNDRFSVWFNEDRPVTEMNLRVRRFELYRQTGGVYGHAEYLERS